MTDRIKELRQKIFGSQAKAEESLNLSRNTFYAYECGKAFFKPRTLQVLASKYSININWLLTGVGDMLLDESNKLSTQEQLQTLQERVKTLEVENKLLKELINNNKHH